MGHVSNSGVLTQSSPILEWPHGVCDNFGVVTRVCATIFQVVTQGGDQFWSDNTGFVTTYGVEHVTLLKW